jgi:hypothetical protein
VAAGVYDRLAVGRWVGCGHFRYAPRRAERFPSPPLWTAGTSPAEAIRRVSALPLATLHIAA